MYTETKYEKDTTDAISKSLSILSDILSRTLGPKGRNILLNNQTSNRPFLCNDGYVILNSLSVDNKFQDVIIKIVRNSINKVNELSGDGTCVTAVLIYELYRESLRYMTAGFHVNALIKGMEQAYHRTKQYIEDYTENSLSQYLVENLAINSAKDEEIGKLIAQAFLEIGKNGLISLRESKKMQNELTFCTGSRIKNGFTSIKLCLQQDKIRIKRENAFILISEVEISDGQLILPFIEFVAQKKAPLLIIAPDVTGAALELLETNIRKGIIDVGAVKAPGIGSYQRDNLADLALVTGANRFILNDTSYFTLDNRDIEQYLGFAKEVIMTAEETTIVDGNRNELEIRKRIQRIEERIDAEDTSSYDKQKLFDRISVLNGKMAILYLGSYSTLRLDEKMTHVIDAIDSVRSALKNGVVPGGGLIYLRASESLKDWADSLSAEEAVGANIMRNALKMPMRYLLDNSGLSAEPIIQGIKEKEFTCGYHVTEEKYCDYYMEGIVDSVFTVNTALLVAYRITVSLIKVSAELVAVKWDQEDYELKKSGFDMIPQL